MLPVLEQCSILTCRYPGAARRSAAVAATSLYSKDNRKCSSLPDGRGCGQHGEPAVEILLQRAESQLDIAGSHQVFFAGDGFKILVGFLADLPCKAIDLGF